VQNHNEFEMFFHVGLGRAASTFLQNRVFPQLEGIHYIHRDRYRSFPKAINKYHHAKYLVSREAALRINSRLREFSKYRRDGKVILVLRRHDQWLASHYRRYVKNGGGYPFDKFVDLDANRPALWGRHNIQFMKMIKMVEDQFEGPPLVLFQEELSLNLERFVSRLTEFTGTTCDFTKIRSNRVHSSYSSTRLKVVRRVSTSLFPPLPSSNPNPNLHRIHRRLHLILCHMILTLARLVPTSFIDDKPLIPLEELARIRDETAEDWSSCLAFAAKHNPTPDQPIVTN
jgi:hypothetical protein